MHVLFYEQAVYERSKRIEKKTYLRRMDSKMVLAMLGLQFNNQERDNGFLGLTDILQGRQL